MAALEQPTMSEHYDDLFKRKNEIDAEPSMVLAYCACALSGFVVGIIMTVGVYELIILF